ncbi:hypothetical protein LUZ60_001438 [Juncus effusus]|nr:hypothetical protein LUZ60_001438 [Juncus effusus]
MNTFTLYQLLFLSFTLSLCISTAIARTSLSHGESLSGDQTLLSEQGEFELGFFSPQNGSYYIAIWFKKVPTRTAIWVANRNSPVSDPKTSQLTVSQDGNLILLDQSKSPIWSSNFTQNPINKSLIATLLDTGNLVISNPINSTDIIWQSFDHPTDTLMAGQWIGINKITGEFQSFASWKNEIDPTSGTYIRQIDPFGSGEYVLLWNHTKAYFYFGQWQSGTFTSIPGMPFNTNLTYDYYQDQYVQKFRYTVRQGTNLTRVVLSPNGQLQRFTYSTVYNQWILNWLIPDSLCDVYSSCGAFGICDLTTINPNCNCLTGFKPVNPFDWNLSSFSGGCVRKSNLKCENDGFYLVSNLRVSNEGYESIQVRNGEECEKTCLNNCSCNAYSYKDSNCLIWSREIRDLKLVSSDNTDSVDLYLRLAKSDLSIKQNKRKMYILTALGVSFGGILIILFISLMFNERKRNLAPKNTYTDGSLYFIKYKMLKQCTNNFSIKLGEGSFGSVFKGKLPDSTQIAVKRLEGLRQGEKQFRTEVRTLGNIQHVNLVRLIGFSLKGSQRLLVYDYMQKKSIDSHLFHSGLKTLDWRKRFQIIVGIARGLAYLHEECRELIIHCDIKPENILLDNEFSPKIADFGMAKLIGRDFGDALTTARGTVGYLAPEWILGMPITPKADVYSFGMMLFEIISGRRNREVRKDQSIGYFPVWAAISVSEGEVESLLDERLNGDANLEELVRVLRVACWCIQDNEMNRPTMVQVVKILEGTQSVGVAPVPKSLQNIAREHYQVVYSTDST